MKTLTPTRILTFVIAIAGTTSATVSAADPNGDAWQHNLLFTPGAKQIEIEQRGRVVIYDGLQDLDVERAMDEQFHRVQSMMFVRTIVTDEQGTAAADPVTGIPIIEDDGCD